AAGLARRTEAGADIPEGGGHRRVRAWRAPGGVRTAGATYRGFGRGGAGRAAAGGGGGGSARRLTGHALGAPGGQRKAVGTPSALVVEKMQMEVLSGDVFLFVGRDRRRAKALFWDGTGLCLYAKRLEKGRFAAPWKRGGGETLKLTMSELALFLEGSELVG